MTLDNNGKIDSKKIYQKKELFKINNLYLEFVVLRHRQTLKIPYRLLLIWDFFMSLLVVLAEYIK